MTLLRMMVLITFALTVSACASQRLVVTVAKPSIPQTKAECDARGGNWTTLGLPYPDKPKMCDLKTTDSGHACSNSSECQGLCMAPDGVANGLKTIGKCSAYVSNFGNVKRVEHGKAEWLNVE